MGKLVQYYHAVLHSLVQDVKKGERELADWREKAEHRLSSIKDLSEHEAQQIMQSVQHDLAEFAQRYAESKKTVSESTFLQSLKEGIWQDLMEVADKTPLEWRQVFSDLQHHGVYQSGDIVGLGEFVCEKCQHLLVITSPEILPPCPKCQHHRFLRKTVVGEQDRD